MKNRGTNVAAASAKYSHRTGTYMLFSVVATLSTSHPQNEKSNRASPTHSQTHSQAHFIAHIHDCPVKLKNRLREPQSLIFNP